MAKKKKDKWEAIKLISLALINKFHILHILFVIVVVVLIRQIESPEWVEIFKIVTSNKIFSLIGWILFVVTLLLSIGIFGLSRSQYLSEIDRLCKERNALQDRLLAANGQPGTQSSKE